jgi:polyisoprenoid-binding protein YceI
MKRSFLLFAMGAVILASCQGDPKADEAKTTDSVAVVAPTTGNVYKADLTQSNVQWTGTKPTGQHTGVMMLKEGSINAEAGNITGGEFTIDMSTMKITDKDTSGAANLAGHLSSGDFFDVAKYPTAKFVISSVTAGIDSATSKDLVMKDATHTITGNLTLKDQTKSVSFPAKVNVADASITADANFNIDRTQWGLVYGNDKGLGNKFIRPTVNVVLHLVANK